MKKVFRINSLIFTAILLLIACKKEEPSSIKEYPHWPVVQTLVATNVDSTTVTLNGTVNGYGLSTTVIFEYGTTTSYEDSVIAFQSPVKGDNISNVSADISGLTPCTTYYFRVKAENPKWVNFYGPDSTFITLPRAKTLAATNVYIKIATLNGEVNANSLLTSVSFEYGLTANYGNFVAAAQSPVTGKTLVKVNAQIRDLIDDTIYHFRIKALNSFEVIYGNDMIFTTSLSPTATDADGNIYDEILIGTQVWMAENLKTTKYNDGTPIPNITDSTAWSNLTTGTGAYCDYNNSPDNATIYGRLYNWNAVVAASNGGKNLCPTGWHVPTYSDWTTLITYLGGDRVAGGLLKESGTIHWEAPNKGATNEFGFTALPGGRCHSGEYSEIGSMGIWWSSSRDLRFPIVFDMYFDSTNVTQTVCYYGRVGGHSVRCVTDN